MKNFEVVNGVKVGNFNSVETLYIIDKEKRWKNGLYYLTLQEAMELVFELEKFTKNNNA